MQLRRSGFLIASFLALAACARSVSQNEPAPSLVVSVFDPGQTGVRAATIPLPNDLALQAAPSQTGITREVLFAAINGGGWPGDQTITVPLRLRTRDAATGAYVDAATPPAALDASTFKADTVAIVRVSDSPPTVLAPDFLGYGPDTVNPALGVIRFRPKGGLPVGRYVVAVRGGANGVKTAASGTEPAHTLGADQPIALVLPNKPLSNPEDLPPVALTAAQVAQLETLRGTFAAGFDWGPVSATTVGNAATAEAICRGALGIPAAAPFPEQRCWLPPLDLAVSPPVPKPSPGITAAFTAVDLVFDHLEAASIQTFEVASPAVVADTTTGVIPFPSDFMLDGATGKVRNLPALGPAAPGLATLDGFSTTSLMLVPLSAPVKASTIPGNVFFYDLGPLGGPPALPRRVVALGAGTPPEFVLQPPSMVVSGASTAIGLQPAVPVPVPNSTSIVPLPPLRPRSRYLVVVTDGVTDLADHKLARGTLANLLLTVQTPLVSGGVSNVPGVSVADATGLQALRDALRNQLLPAIAGDLGTRQVVMAYTMTTQDVKTISAELTALPYSVEQAAGGPFFTTSAVADFDPTAAPVSLPAALFTHVKKFLSGNVVSLDVLDAATGALDPTIETWGPAQFVAHRVNVPFLAAVPNATGLRPLVIFHHGIFGSRYQMLPVADQLAEKGFVVVAIDAPFHGDRAFCADDGDCNGGTCTLAPTNFKAPGTCTGGSGLAFDPTRLSTKASGNDFISENFFRFRDVVREDLLDQSALVLAAARPVPVATDPLTAALGAAGVGVVVDPTKVYFAGLSLGGMIGTSLVATNPRISRAALNVAGGTLVDVFTTAPAFQTDVATLLAGLVPGFTFQKVDPTNAAYDPAVAQAYAQTLIVAKWILDPADPINYAADLTNKDAANATLKAALGPLAVSSTAAYGQLVQNDPVVPNPLNRLLYLDAGLSAVPNTAITNYTSDTLSSDLRHGLLLLPPVVPGGTDGQVIRQDLANFLFDLTVPATPDVALP